MAVKPIPEGHHTVTPYLVVRDVAAVIDFVTRAFGASEVARMPGPGGRIVHAEVRIGDSLVMLGEAPEGVPPVPAMLHLYVEDADAVYQQAIKAGGTVVREIADQFYGDRSGGVKDSQGNQWWVATHKEDVSMAEMQRRMAAMPRG